MVREDEHFQLPKKHSNVYIYISYLQNCKNADFNSLVLSSCGIVSPLVDGSIDIAFDAEK